MEFSTKNKKYGLTIPNSMKKSSGKLAKAASIFQNESSEEDESRTKMAINLELNAVAEKKKQTKQTKEEIERALKEDPNVYKYDEIYEAMEKKKVDSSKVHKENEKKPKYIASLLKSAAMRKREQERRVERSVQREREKEGDKFADKESFVTAAYRQKMLDQAEEEERLRKQDELDALHDVTKQKDLSQFYRNLLNRNISMGAEGDKVDDEKAKEEKEPEESRRLKEIRKHRRDESTSASKQVLQQRLPLPKGKDTLEGDERIKNVEVLHRDKSSMRFDAGSQKKSKHAESPEASTSDDSSGGKRRRKRTVAAEKFMDSSEKLSYRSYKRREDREGWTEKRPILQTSSSDSEENSHNKKIVSERNHHRKGERREKDRTGSSRNRNGSSGRRSSSRERRKKKSKRNVSLSESSLSENETREEAVKSDQKPTRGSRIYDDREVHENRQSKRSRNKSSKKELTHNSKTKTYDSDGSNDDGDARKIEMSSRHAAESSRGKGEERKDNREKETINEKRLKIFARHNDADSISSARERYLARKRARIVPQVHEDDSDD